MQFSKMHSLGNDFMVIDAIRQNIFLSSKLIRRLSNRHTGVGFDQLLIVEPPCDPQIDFCYRIFNIDGSEVTQCGNGACCFAHFVRLKALTNKRNIRIKTKNRYMILNVIKYGIVCVNMGEPNFEPSLIPFLSYKGEKKFSIYFYKKK